MLKITRVGNGDVVFRLSGRMDAENLGEMETLLSAEASDRIIILDLKDLRLVDQDVVSFLRRCEAGGIQIENCPAYIREWINGERQ
jgi:anti-anti-sigma regulatory factor